ncbi:hypothetical protein IEQ34_015128 [Dendrobium chrysotoxum]|uniref:Uncharacterized protein n=1 Tax=Dendrobium chrysotoxum TaxID=161865 RepID=A0AAV7GM15_DENCH|nr:hypothetical protein IEQ34_015128 [Dendrobium chrysotoxum]
MIDLESNLSTTTLGRNDIFSILRLSNEELSLEIPENLRHLSVQITILDILRKIGKFKYVHSPFLFYSWLDNIRNNHSLLNLKENLTLNKAQWRKRIHAADPT